MQKFEQKKGGKQPKAKFRQTVNRFVDDPTLLMDADPEYQARNDTSLEVADKLDKMQKQYMSQTAMNGFPAPKGTASMQNSMVHPLNLDAPSVKEDGWLKN